MRRKNNTKPDIKRGPLSREEKSQIANFSPTKTDEEIARLIKRPVKQVTAYKAEYMANAPEVVIKKSEAEEFKIELHSDMDWTRFKKEFTPDELLFFENDYINYRGQLKDVTASERKQLFNLITLNIFMHRHNTDRMKNQQDIVRMERILAREYEQPEDIQYQNHERIVQLEAQIQTARTNTGSQTKEYKDLLEKSQSIQRDLKSTRDQRIKNLEDRGRFVVFLKELELEDRRKGIGEVMGLMNLATDKERERLSALHTYADGAIDRPLLIPEDIDEDEG